MNNKILAILIFLLFFLNVMLIRKVNVINIAANDFHAVIYDTIEALKFRNNFLLEEFIFQLRPKIKLDSSLMVESEAGEKILLKDFILNNKLVFCFTETSCMSCIKAQFELLEKSKSLFENKNILILLLNCNGRTITNFKKSMRVEFDIYSIHELVVTAEKEDIPYYFNLDRNLIATNFFFPVTELPDLSILYLEAFSKQNSFLKN